MLLILLNRLIHLLLAPARRTYFAVFRRVWVKEEVHGVTAYDATALDPGTSALPQVRRGIELIAIHSPQVLRRLQHHLNGIVVDDVTRTAYYPELRLATLNRETVKLRSDLEIACSLAHEVTHAVLRDKGFRYEGVQRGRIEAACVGAERRLAARIPGGSAYAATVEEKLAEEWWTEEKLKAVGDNYLRKAGVPEWLVRARRAIGRGAK